MIRINIICSGLQAFFSQSSSKDQNLDKYKSVILYPNFIWVKLERVKKEGQRFIHLTPPPPPPLKNADVLNGWSLTFQVNISTKGFQLVGERCRKMPFCLFSVPKTWLRGINSYSKMGGQVVMWHAFYSAKTWVGNCQLCPSTIDTPGKQIGLVKPNIALHSFLNLEWKK